MRRYEWLMNEWLRQQQNHYFAAGGQIFLPSELLTKINLKIMPRIIRSTKLFQWYKSRSSVLCYIWNFCIVLLLMRVFYIRNRKRLIRPLGIPGKKQRNDILTTHGWRHNEIRADWPLTGNVTMTRAKDKDEGRHVSADKEFFWIL